MQSALRPYTTTGVAIVGASLIAVTPVAAPLPDIATVRDVALTAGDSLLGGLLAPWIDQFNTAAQNATVLADNFFLAPGVGLQQAIANELGFAGQILNDPSSIPTVVNQMQENLASVLTSLTLLNASSDTLTATTLHTLLSTGGLGPGPGLSIEGGPGILFQLLPAFLPADQVSTLTPIIDFLASPVSGILIGALGPFISPLVALVNSISAGDGFSEILANTVGAFFNGATINLDSLIPFIESSGLLPLPAGTIINHLDFALGGLFTPGDVSAGPYDLYDGSGDVVTSIPAAGGSIFNSLGIDISASLAGTPVGLEITPAAVGPIGALEGLSQTIAGLLGAPAWSWDAKNNPGVPSPPATPPLTGASLPTIPDDFFDDGGASTGATADVAHDLPTGLAQLAAELGLSI